MAFSMRDRNSISVKDNNINSSRPRNRWNERIKTIQQNFSLDVDSAQCVSTVSVRGENMNTDVRGNVHAKTVINKPWCEFK